MLIKALCDYYDYTEKNTEDQLPNHLSEQNVHYMIMLSECGEIDDILDIQNETALLLNNGKTKTLSSPTVERLPKRSQKTSIALNIIEHRPLYIFGLNYDKGLFTPEDKTNKAKKSHECFVEGNLEFCKNLTSSLAKAYCLFLEKWIPAEQCENPHLLRLGKNYATSYYSFALSGHPEVKLHKDTNLLEKYQLAFEHGANTEVNPKDCLVCPMIGENLPTARIHNKINGVKGGNSVGCVLVGVKENAFESYGKTQSFNSGISQIAMEKYTASLNKLISNKHHRIFLDDMTIVFFGITQNDEKECDFFRLLINNESQGSLDSDLETIATGILTGCVSDLSSFDIDRNTLFYVAGLTPNSSRISQKFIFRNKFGTIIDQLLQHQKDMVIRTNAKQISLHSIYRELVSPKSSEEKIPVPLLAAILQSVLYGTPYPQAMLSTVIRRIKTDSDNEKNHFIKINSTRISIIKACLNRKARHAGKREEITMALDTQNNNPAYLCGRLFALLEYVQRKASDSELNRTIKDSFFSSACAKPSVVFPKLIKLSQNHMGKLDGGGYFNKLMGEIIAQLENEFPQTLSLDDQGKFIIGYYHENSALYTPKSTSTATN